MSAELPETDELQSSESAPIQEAQSEEHIDEIINEIEKLQEEIDEPENSKGSVSETDSLAEEGQAWEEVDKDSGLLSMSIQGNMNLKLNYQFDQFVVIGIQSGFLQIRLSDGSEFKVPIRSKGAQKIK